MERALLETPLFSLANRPGDLCTETSAFFNRVNILVMRNWLEKLQRVCCNRALRVPV